MGEVDAYREVSRELPTTTPVEGCIEPPNGTLITLDQVDRVTIAPLEVSKPEPQSDFSYNDLPDYPLSFSHLPAPEVDAFFDWRKPDNTMNFLWFIFLALICWRMFTHQVFLIQVLNFLLQLRADAVMSMISMGPVVETCFILFYYVMLTNRLKTISPKISYRRVDIDQSSETDERRIEKLHHSIIKYTKPMYATYEVVDVMGLAWFLDYPFFWFSPSRKRQYRLNVSLELFTQLSSTVVSSSDQRATFLRLNRDIMRVASINVDRAFAAKTSLVSDTAMFIMAYSLHLRDTQMTEVNLN
jgi:hypothetical protein